MAPFNGKQLSSILSFDGEIRGRDGNSEALAMPTSLVAHTHMQCVVMYRSWGGISLCVHHLTFLSTLGVYYN